MNAEDLYLKLPIFAQNIASNIEGLKVNRRRYGGDYKKITLSINNRNQWPQEKIIEYRDRRIRDFVKSANENVPYYNNQFKKIGVDIRDIQTLEDLKKLPILTKQTVKDNYLDFQSDSIPFSQLEKIHTSGTDGGGLIFNTTRIALQEQWAVWWRYRESHGIQMRTWCGYFGGRSIVPVTQKKPPYWRVNKVSRQIFFSAYHMTKKNLDLYIEEIIKRKLTWLHGYPSSLSLLAGRLLEVGHKPISSIKWVTLGAENLTNQQAELIKKAFCVNPIQHYGMAEAVANISQCPLGNLHVDEDFSAVEFLWHEESQSYKIIGTNLSNFATPLIRYEVGDFATLGNNNCSCGNVGRTVESLDGRLEDYIEMSNGAKVGRLDHIVKDQININECQFVQEIPGKATLNLVRGKNYGDKDEDDLKKEIAKRLGGDFDIRVKYVDFIPKTSRGKLRFVIARSDK